MRTAGSAKSSLRPLEGQTVEERTSLHRTSWKKIEKNLQKNADLVMEYVVMIFLISEA